MVNPTQTFKLPVIEGNGLIVTSAVFWQEPELVKVMVAVPAEIPVTNPVLETVATAGFEEVHGFVAAGIPVALNCVVAPTQAFKVPEMVGVPSTFKVIVLEHPFELV
ncbi:hypothetical protein D3C86_1172520 [compost metagenome]